MIKISSTPYTSTTAPKKSKRSSKSADGNFADVMSAAEEGSTSVNASKSASATSPVNSLLSLQEISDEELATKKAVKHGQATLNSLEELRMALLTGRMPAHLLSDLEKHVAEQRLKTNDPELEAILDDIELRAAVEVAKRDTHGTS